MPFKPKSCIITRIETVLTVTNHRRIRKIVAGKMEKNDQNEKTEWEGLKIHPVFPPQGNTDWLKAQTLGPDEEQLLTTLYYDHSKWLEEMKTVCKRAGISLEQHLRKALGLAVEAGRVRDCDYDTGLRLRGPERTGQDILLFFVKKCPHAREGLLRGELPPYPWRISQASGQKQNATPAKCQGSVTYLGKILEKVLYIFTRSFWDAVFDRYWPK